MLTKDFFYELPEELIAQTPAEKRSSSRLLVYNRKTREIIDTVFENITDYLVSGDLLVRNTTKVLPARLYAERTDTKGHAEFLLLERDGGDIWNCIAKPARRIKSGLIYKVNDELSIRVIGDTEADGGKRIELLYNGIFEEILDRAGTMPLPPYIKKKVQDASRYQTVYARELGSAAAPTAGLHFTNELIDAIQNKGACFADVLLHVGLGTFRPVNSEKIEDHKMHSEYYQISNETAEKINQAKVNHQRVIAIGTTTVRTLESVASSDGLIKGTSGKTDIFITPGYQFKCVDALITNFHLPESTLLMLVSALCTRDEVMRIYQHAIEEKYRFFSFGDAMFII